MFNRKSTPVKAHKLGTYFRYNRSRILKLLIFIYLFNIHLIFIFNIIKNISKFEISEKIIYVCPIVK